MDEFTAHRGIQVDTLIQLKLFLLLTGFNNYGKKQVCLHTLFGWLVAGDRYALKFNRRFIMDTKTEVINLHPCFTCIQCLDSDWDENDGMSYHCNRCSMPTGKFDTCEHHTDLEDE